MSHESSRSAVEIASIVQGTKVPIRSPKSVLSKFGRAARGLWPHKTAAELAFRAQVTERAAKYWLSGEREPSAMAIGIIIAEITSRE